MKQSRKETRAQGEKKRGESKLSSFNRQNYQDLITNRMGGVEMTLEFLIGLSSWRVAPFLREKEMKSGHFWWKDSRWSSAVY